MAVTFAYFLELNKKISYILGFQTTITTDVFVTRANDVPTGL